MANGMLQTLVALEQTIQECLAEEGRRARSWKESELERLAADMRAFEARLTQLEKEWGNAAQERWQNRTQADEADAISSLRLFEQFSEDNLRRVLTECLDQILPEGDDDHQDVES